MKNKSSQTLLFLLIGLSLVAVIAIAMIGFGIGFMVLRAGDGVSSPQITTAAPQTNQTEPRAEGTVRQIDDPKIFAVFWEAVDLLQENFDGEVPSGNDITYAAIQGVMEGFDVCVSDEQAINLKAPPAPAEAPANFAFFWQTVNQLYADCGGEAPLPDDLVYLAINGVIERLDNHYTSILPPEAAAAFRTDMSGQFEGIGATVEPADDEEGTGVRIVEPFAGSPAELAGLQPGDEIVTVDGQSVVELPLDEAVRLIRGPAKSIVQLSVKRGTSPLFDVEVERARIDIPIITSEIIEDDLLHVRLADFSARAATELRDAIAQGLEAGINGVILDLRGNPGGRLDISIAVASMFIEDGLIVSETGERNIEHEAEGDALLPDLPMVVLVNGGSASASEIVAGAIQDYDRGLLVGETTFGKGSVQSLFNLSDDSLLRVTVARWFTPQGHQIDGSGLQPDIEVPFIFNPDQPEADPQLEAAIDILRTQLAGS